MFIIFKKTLFLFFTNFLLRSISFKRSHRVLGCGSISTIAKAFYCGKEKFMLGSIYVGVIRNFRALKFTLGLD